MEITSEQDLDHVKTKSVDESVKLDEVNHFQHFSILLYHNLNSDFRYLLLFLIPSQ